MATAFGEDLGDRFNVVVIGKDLVGKSSLCDALVAFANSWKKVCSKGERSLELKGIQKAVKDAASHVKKREKAASKDGNGPSSPRNAEDSSRSLFHHHESDIHAYNRSAQGSDLHLNLACLDFPGRLDFRSAHSFFYPSEHVVFLICWSLEDKDLEDTQVERWASYVRAWRPDVPIIAVGTNLDKIGKRSEISAPDRVARMKETLTERFHGIEDVVSVSNITLDGYDTLIDRIMTVASRSFSELSPNHKQWKSFGEQLHREIELLESLSGLPVLRWDKVNQVAIQARVIASTEGEVNAKKLQAAIEYLASTGQLILFTSASNDLKSVPFAISTHLEYVGKLFAGACTTSVINGAVSADDFQLKFLKLRDLVREEDWQPTLHLLNQTEFVCPSVTKTFDFLIPSMFSIQKPDGVEEHLAKLIDSVKPDEDAVPEKCKGTVLINYLPDGLFSRILTRCLRDGECSLFWRNGAIIKLGVPAKDTIVFLEWRPDRTGISIEVAGFNHELANKAFGEIQTLVEDTIRSAAGVKITSGSRIVRRASKKFSRSLSRNDKDDRVAVGSIPTEKVSKTKRSAPDLLSNVKKGGSSSPSSPRSKVSKDDGAIPSKTAAHRDAFEAGGEANTAESPADSLKSSQDNMSDRSSSPSRPKPRRAKSSVGMLQTRVSKKNLTEEVVSKEAVTSV